MWPIIRDYQMKVYVYMNYIICFITGFVRDQIDHLRGKTRNVESGYVPVVSDLQCFFLRRFYSRISDCFARIVASNAGAYLDLKVAKITDDIDNPVQYTAETKNVLNLGSYNYLGFNDNDEYCTPKVIDELKKFGPSSCSPSVELGTTSTHLELERKLAEFIGTEDAICFGTGWQANSTSIAALMKKGDLILADFNVNDALIISARRSEAVLKFFRHNDIDHFEKILRRELINGQPRTHRLWGRILVIVEGTYTATGDMLKFHELMKCKKRYHFSIWLDESNSLGVKGENGRGTCEMCSINPRDIDFISGSLDNSFGAPAGFIAGCKKAIDFFRLSSFGYIYSESIPAPCARQAISAIELLQSTEGKRRLKQFNGNSVWFRHELMKNDFKVLGEDGSPIVLIKLPPFALLSIVSRRCLERNLALAVVTFPLIDVLDGHIKVCLNALHSKKELRKAINILEESCQGLPAKVH